MIILHIGFPKTATTSLQRIFRDNKEPLRKLGVYYPLADEDFKQRCLKDLLVRKGQVEHSLSASASKRLQDLKHLILRSNDRAVLLSCEELTNELEFELDFQSLSKLRNFFSGIGRVIYPVVYVRNPADYYLSRMQESLKSRPGIIQPKDFQSRMAWVISQYELAFEVPVKVRAFAQDQLFGGGISSDFWESVRELVNVKADDLAEIHINESLSAEVMYALDFLKSIPAKYGFSQKFTHEENRVLWKNLQQIDVKLGKIVKPKLFACAAREILQANSDDITKLRERHQIVFSEHRALEIDNPLPYEGRLVSVEGIVPVQRERALALVAAVAARGIKAIARAQ